MKCKFVKWNGFWWRLIDSIDELIENTTAIDSSITLSMCNATGNDERATDKDKEITEKLETYAEIKGLSVVESIANLGARRVEKQLQYLNKGEVILANERGGWNSIKLKGDEIILTKEGHTFPQYTEKDIRIKQFGLYEKSTENGARHYYAWVGETEVRNNDSNKWNTYSDAYNQALKYIM